MRIKWIYFLPCIVLTPSLAKTQQPNIGGMVGDAMGQAMGEIMKRIELQPKIEPAVSTIDPEKKTATITFSSISKDTLDVTLSFTADSAGPSLVPWIKDLPKTIILLPKGKQEVTVTLNVPKDAAAGTYSAIVKASGQRRSPPSSSPPTGGISVVTSGGIEPSSKLVYTVK